jgi:hypothetical protein
VKRGLFSLVIFLAVLTAALATSCKVQITVPKGGKVITESGDYECKSGEVCSIDIYDLFFDQAFIATPAEGYVFARWEKVARGLCAYKSTPCRIASAWASIHEVFMELLESDDVFYLEPVFANTWSQVGEDIPGEAGGDRSGASVSISSDGSRLAVGAPGNTDGDHDLYDIGQVRVYRWTGSVWLQLGADIDGKAEGDGLGGSVSLSDRGDRLAVGAAGADENGERSGQVQVYSWSGSAWQHLGKAINGEAAFDYAGIAVSLSDDGNRLAIGAKDNDGGGYNSGHVRVYHWNGTGWRQLGLDIDGKEAYELSGYAVSLSAKGDYLAVGAIYNEGNGDKSGAARVYKWTGVTWQQLGADIQGKNLYNQFGISVSLSANGTRLAIGSVQGDYVQVYEWSDSQWKQLGADIIGDSIDGKFGSSLSLSADGRRLAIGDQRHDDNGYSSGQVAVYSWSGTDWRQLLGDLNGRAKLDYFGASTSLSRYGNRLAVGASGGGGNSRGYAGVYEMDYDDAPRPSVDPMKVYLLKPEHTEIIPQNNPATGCAYDPQVGYGLRVDFDWSDAESPAGIEGYNFYVIGRRASKPIIDVFVTTSEYTWISCGGYVINPTASSGFVWSVEAEDNVGNLGPVNDEGFFVFELCYLDNGQPCGGN